jgi:hypothetical protein
MKNLPTFIEFLNESKGEVSNNLFTYRKSNVGKPTMILRLTEEGLNKVKHLFDEEGRPIDDSIKSQGFERYSWDLHIDIKPVIINKIPMFDVYGTSADSTFGNSPWFFAKSLRGNIKAARKIYSDFIEKYLTK